MFVARVSSADDPHGSLIIVSVREPESLIRDILKLRHSYKFHKELSGEQVFKVRRMIPLPIEQLEWAFFGGIVCLIPVVWFIVGLLLCIWVYRDAESRGMGGALWLIIVLIASIIGLIIYLVVRKDKKPEPPPPQS